MILKKGESEFIVDDVVQGVAYIEVKRSSDGGVLPTPRLCEIETMTKQWEKVDDCEGIPAIYAFNRISEKRTLFKFWPAAVEEMDICIIYYSETNMI